MKKIALTILLFFLIVPASHAEHEYVVDHSQADHGAVSGGSNLTVKDIVDSVGASKYAVVHFTHDPDNGNTTVYNFDTSLDLSTYPHLLFKFDPGAQLDRITGDEVFTLYSPENLIVGKGQQLTIVDILSFASDGTVYVEWWGGKADDSTDCTNAFAYSVGSMATPSLHLMQGTYQHSGLSWSADGMAVKGQSINGTVLKNIGSGNSITLSAHNISVESVTVDQNNVVGHGVYVTGQHLSLYKVKFLNHGNATSAKWGIYGEVATAIEIRSCIMGNLETAYGGHLKLVDTFAPIIRDAVWGNASTDSANGYNIYIDNCPGFIISMAYIDPGAAGSLYVNNTDGGAIFGLCVEPYQGRTAGGLAWTEIVGCRAITINGGFFSENTNAGNIVPFMRIADSQVISVQSFNILRRIGAGVNDAAVFSLGADCEQIEIANIRYDNQIDGGGANIDFVAVDTGGNAMRGLKLTQQMCGARGIYKVHNVDGYNVSAVLGQIDIDASVNVGQTHYGLGQVSNVGSIVTTGSVVKYHGTGEGAPCQIVTAQVDSGALSGSSVIVPIQVPANSRLVGAVVTVLTDIVDSEGSGTWSAEWNDGCPVLAIDTGIGASAGTVAGGPAATHKTTGAVTNIKLMPDGGTFIAGEVRVVGVYELFYTP